MKKLLYLIVFTLGIGITTLYGCTSQNINTHTIITQNEIKELKVDRLIESFSFYTKKGKHTLRSIIINPITDRKTLKNRQHFLKTLHKSSVSDEYIQKLLKKLGEYESVFEQLNNTEIKTLYPHSQFLSRIFSSYPLTLLLWNAYSFLTTGFDVINKVGFLGFVKEAAFFIDGTQDTLSFKRAVDYGWQEVIKQHQFWIKHNEYNRAGHKYGLSDFIYLAYPHNMYHKFLEKFKKIPKILAFCLSALPVIFYDIKLFESLTKMKQGMQKLRNAVSSLRKQLKQLKDFVKTTNLMIRVLEKFDHINEIFPEIKRIKHVLDNNNILVSLENLNEHSINTGKLLYVYQNCLKEMHLLSNMKVLVEKVDAYISVVNFMKNAENNQLPCCFVEFEQGAPEAYIIAEHSWNPLVKKSVQQSINLSLKHAAGQKMIITGPNGSGKSGYVSQVGILLLLAQSFGIAPAQSCTMTLFSYLRTSLDPQGDLEKGISKFMQQKNHAQEMLDLAQAKSSPVCLFLVDEMLNGTVHTETEKRIKEFVLSLAENQGVICLITTHLEKPTALEAMTEGKWKNYYVEVIPQENTFIRTYLLKPGIMSWWFDDTELRGRYVDWVEVNK